MSKKYYKIFISVGTVLTIVGLLIDALATDAFAMLLEFSSFAFINAILAVCLITSKNNVVENIGVGLSAYCGVYGIVKFAVALNSEIFYTSYLGMSIMIIGAIVYYISFVLNYFGYKRATGVSQKDPYEEVNSYYKMKNEGIINEQEYEGLKSAVIEKIGKNNSTVSDLGKWKKLLDQSIITDGEFIKLKAAILGK
ncbi:MAG: hypothetical protein ACI3XS_06195 [Eubacteriales bacterium]